MEFRRKQAIVTALVSLSRRFSKTFFVIKCISFVYPRGPWIFYDPDGARSPLSCDRDIVTICLIGVKSVKVPPRCTAGSPLKKLIIVALLAPYLKTHLLLTSMTKVANTSCRFLFRCIVSSKIEHSDGFQTIIYLTVDTCN